jgi:hypothetical protein
MEGKSQWRQKIYRAILTRFLGEARPIWSRNSLFDRRATRSLHEETPA